MGRINVTYRIFVGPSGPNNVPVCAVTALLRHTAVPARPAHMPREAMHLLGPKGPAKIEEVTLMRPIHGNL